MIKQLWSEEKYTTEELNARLKFFIGIILGLTLFGIVFVVLYSLIFVTQPMNGMSPVDNKFFELIIPVATFLTGTSLIHRLQSQFQHKNVKNLR
jgi:Na+-transporting methylmalonyl-CoA/oxaloacetate decarboxylase gamma subunit